MPGFFVGGPVGGKDVLAYTGIKGGGFFMTEQIQIVMPAHVNGVYRLFGGQLMAWIDVVASVAARRHCGLQVITAVVDGLDFLSPVYLNDLLVIQASVTWTGNTSMEVQVKTFVEQAEGHRDLVNLAYLVMVAVDQSNQPAAVKPFLPQTQEQKEQWEAAVERRQWRLANRRRFTQEISAPK